MVEPVLGRSSICVLASCCIIYFIFMYLSGPNPVAFGDGVSYMMENDNCTAQILWRVS